MTLLNDLWHGVHVLCFIRPEISLDDYRKES